MVRVHGTSKALAFTSDVTPRYVKANPVEGGKQAVAEAWRNLVAAGATPLAATDNLNFGNPEKPEIMGQFVGAIQGIGEACRALDFPIVSGNVSLYNETDGQAILPTPTIGAVGLIEAPDDDAGAVLFSATGLRPGATQTRWRRPRPAVCSGVTNHIGPCSPSRARSIASALVEPIWSKVASLWPAAMARGPSVNVMSDLCA
mgnify:CR=1 FL=1